MMQNRSGCTGRTGGTTVMWAQRGRIRCVGWRPGDWGAPALVRVCACVYALTVVRNTELRLCVRAAVGASVGQQQQLQQARSVLRLSAGTSSLPPRPASLPPLPSNASGGRQHGSGGRGGGRQSPPRVGVQLLQLSAVPADLPPGTAGRAALGAGAGASEILGRVGGPRGRLNVKPHELDRIQAQLRA
jgi:hypothetical protein